jgi:alginate O-acetyltransferase complex protein AlgI
MFGSSGELFDAKGVYYILEYRAELVFAVIAALPVKKLLERVLENRRGAAAVLYAWGPRLLALGLLALSYLKLVTGSFNPFIYFRF